MALILENGEDDGMKHQPSSGRIVYLYRTPTMISTRHLLMHNALLLEISHKLLILQSAGRSIFNHISM
jgi:hypothetical protein